MKVSYSVFFDGERKPSIKSSDELNAILDKFVEPASRGAMQRDIAQGVKVDHTNRRKGVRIVLTNPNKKVKVKERKAYEPLHTTLEGKACEAQIKVAACNKLKSSEGWHRTVCIVEANGLAYRVKCMHKGLTYTEAVYRCEIVSKAVL